MTASEMVLPMQFPIPDDRRLTQKADKLIDGYWNTAYPARAIICNNCHKPALSLGVHAVVPASKVRAKRIAKRKLGTPAEKMVSTKA